MGLHEDFHKIAHEQHRKRVLEAKPIIDSKPPILHVGNFSQFSKLKTDVTTFVERNKTNAEMLVHLNEIFRTRGITDSYRTQENSGHCVQSTTVPMRIRAMEKIEQENMVLGKRLLCTKAELDTWQKMPTFRNKRDTNKKDKKAKAFVVPQEVLKKYGNIDIPQDPNVLKKFLRPQIWFDLEVKDIRPLGRIVIQLFTEAAPQVVLEFVRLCFDQNKELLKFVRLFPSLWIEGQIQLLGNTLMGKNIEYDKRTVDHGLNAGVLSFSMEHMKYYKNALFYYSVSFKPLNVLNGHRVGFGRVIHGLKILDCIQDYGTKNGKPTREIIVSDCGIVK